MPPFLATAGARLAAVVLASFLLFGLGYWKGAQAVQLRWDAAIAQQAVKSADTVMKTAENSAQVVTKYIKVKGETEVITQTVEKEVIRYVEREAPRCAVDPDFERLFDAANRVPAAPDPSGGAAPEGEPGPTVAEVLQAHTELAGRYFALADRHDALVDWVQSSYEIQKAGAGR